MSDLSSLLADLGADETVKPEVKVNPEPAVSTTPATVPESDGVEPAVVTTMAPAVGVVVGPPPSSGAEYEEVYKHVTLDGLHLHRPDLIAAIAPARRTTSSRPSTPKKDPLSDFTAYHLAAVTILNEDPTKVTGRRLTNMRKKYIAALAASNLDVPDGSTVSFVINGAEINAVWAGEAPTSMPEALVV